MKTLLVIALLVLSQNAHAWGNWMPEPYDKVAHFAVSAGLTVAGAKLCQEYTEFSKTTCAVASGIATFAITGPGKEWSDINWSNEDMAASGAGAAVGIGITLAF